MRFSATIILGSIFAGCSVSHPSAYLEPVAIGMNSFALAARYGTPASYQHQGEYLQLNYGSAAAGCKVTFLVDQRQRVAGWASAGLQCGALPHRPDVP